MMKGFLRTFSLILGIVFVFAANTVWAELTVGYYTLVSSKRVSRVEYEYTYQAQVTNDGEAAKNVMAQVTSSSPYTTVIEGLLEFGDVASGTVVDSSDTFIIKHNRSYPLEWSALVWDIQYDPIDNCPDDPTKTEPGVCGCNVSDTDTDGDGVMDCNDQCPDDPVKIEAGVCGCGVADTDSDSDGVLSCFDECPNTQLGEIADLDGCSGTQRVTGIIGPEGGSIEAILDGSTEVKIQIPEQIFTDEKRITISVVDGMEDDFDGQPITPIFEFEPDGAHFARDVNITFTISQDYLQDAGCSSLEVCKEFLNALYLDEENDVWKPLDIIEINSEENRVTIATNHFTKMLIGIGYYTVDRLILTSPAQRGGQLSFTLIGKWRTLLNFNNNVHLSASIKNKENGDVIGSEVTTVSIPDENESQEFGIQFDSIALPTDLIGALELEIQGSTLTGRKTCWEQEIILDYDDTTTQNISLLEQYRPTLFFSESETYFPTDITHVFNENNNLKLDGKELSNVSKNDLAVNASNRYKLQYDGRNILYQAPTVYGSIIETTTHYYLIYMFYYHFDPKSSAVAEFFTSHVNDCERIVVVLSKDGLSAVPEFCVYGHHLKEWSGFTQHIEYLDNDDEVTTSWDEDIVVLSWSNVLKNNDSPYVYIAEGSHACYPRQGTYKGYYGGIYAFSDYAGIGNGNIWGRDHYTLQIIPRMSSIDSTSPDYNFLLYSGDFGTDGPNYKIISHRDWWLFPNREVFLTDANLRIFPFNDSDGDGIEDNADNCPDTPYSPTEICDGLDNDCNGLIDDGLDFNTYGRDADYDGYGDPNDSYYGCSGALMFVDNNLDCDDTDPTIYEGATETPYDGIDQNCDGSDLTDVDGDGYDSVIVGGSDVNDENPDINPDATEVCGDGIDNDSDGEIDEGCDPVVYSISLLSGEYQWLDDDQSGVFTFDGAGNYSAEIWGTPQALPEHQYITEEGTYTVDQNGIVNFKMTDSSLDEQYQAPDCYRREGRVSQDGSFLAYNNRTTICFNYSGNMRILFKKGNQYSLSLLSGDYQWIRDNQSGIFTFDGAGHYSAEIWNTPNAPTETLHILELGDYTVDINGVVNLTMTSTTLSEEYQGPDCYLREGRLSYNGNILAYNNRPSTCDNISSDLRILFKKDVGYDIASLSGEYQWINSFQSGIAVFDGNGNYSMEVWGMPNAPYLGKYKYTYEEGTYTIDQDGVINFAMTVSTLGEESYPECYKREGRLSSDGDILIYNNRPSTCSNSNDSLRILFKKKPLPTPPLFYDRRATGANLEYDSVNNIVNIFWNQVEGASKYEVLYGTEPSINNTSRLLVSTPTNNISTTNFASGGRYYYRVRAVSSSGKFSDLSDEITVSISGRPEVYLSGDVFGPSEPFYQWGYGFTPGKEVELLFQHESGHRESSIIINADWYGDFFNLVDLPENLMIGNWDFWALDLDSRVQSIIASFEIIDSIESPIFIQYYYNTGENHIFLEWHPISQAESYEIFWGTSPYVDLGSEYLGSTDSTEFIHTGVEPGLSYYYRIRAIDSNGFPSELSDVVEVSYNYATPVISAYPDTGSKSSGTTIAENGYGFTPNGNVTLHFIDPGDIHTTIPKNANENGNVFHSYTCHSGTAEGVWEYYAVDEMTGERTISVMITIVP